MTTTDALQALRGVTVTAFVLLVPFFVVFVVGQRDFAFALAVLWKLVVFPHDWMFRHSEPFFPGRSAAFVAIAQWLTVAFVLGWTTRRMHFARQVLACFGGVLVIGAAANLLPPLFGVTIAFDLL
jgi:hypothetical protein